MKNANAEQKATRSLVWRLGLVSFFTDVSSDAIIPTLVFFFTGTLGGTAWQFGLTEGIAEATSALFKAPSGILSDLFARRKPIVIWGYSLSTLGKFALPLSHIWPSVLGARFLDRIGKGIRTSPRDGILADGVPAHRRGWAFGIHRAMDSSGAVLGPLLAWWFLSIHHNDFRTLYWLAIIPAIISVILLTGIREPVRTATKRQAGAVKAALPPSFMRYLFVMTLFSLGNSSDLFLLLRLNQLGWNPASVLLAYAGFNAVAAIGSVPLGHLSDKIGRKTVLSFGFFVFALVYFGFALATPEMKWLPIVLLIGYGLYYAFTDGVGRAYAADLAGDSWRGSGLGVYHTCIGLAILPASLMAGYFIDKNQLSAPFFIGSFAAIIAILGLWLVVPKKVSYQ